MGGIVGIQTQNKAVPNTIGLLPPPGEGPRAFTLVFDFSGGTANIPLQLNAQDYGISFCQTLFIDNSNNNSSASFTIAGSQQKIICPANCQGFFPVAFQQGLISLIANSAGGVSVPVQFMNVRQDMMVWSTTAPGSVAGTVTVSGVVQTQALAVTDNATTGTLTPGATDTVILAANGARKGLILLNPVSSGEYAYIRFGAAAGIDDGLSIELPPGGALQYLSGVIPTQAVHGIATTNNHKIVVHEYV